MKEEEQEGEGGGERMKVNEPKGHDPKASLRQTLLSSLTFNSYT